MNKKTNLFLTCVFVLLSFGALLYIAYDFTMGHTIDEVMSLEYCPACDAFHSANKAVILLFSLVIAGNLVCLGVVFCFSVLIHSSLYHTLFALRAPPVAS